MARPQQAQPIDSNDSDHHNHQDNTTSSIPRPGADQPLTKTINATEPIQTENTPADEHEAWANWVYPPEFYDRLSKIHLTHEALAELDRRNRLALHHPRHQSCETGSFLLSTMLNEKDLARCARHGGPDLMDLCNFPPPTSRPACVPKKNKPSPHTTTVIETKKSTPYNADFEQHLTDHDVQATYDSQKPAKWAETQAALSRRRPSLTSSQFSESAFASFQDNNDRAKTEDSVMVNIIPVILGKNGPGAGRHAFERNILFNNFAPLTDGSIVQPKPDIYYGARPKLLSRSVRNALGHHIVPSTTQDKPLAPNFFVEVKGPNGNAAVALRQARYDGAVGTRAMYNLQNYRKKEPKDDNQAYTYTSIYHSGTGTLNLYAHHITTPTSQGGRPEYHMTRIRGFTMTDTRETFVQGATAFRNARDLAQQYRDGFIQAANDAAKKRVSQSSGVLETIEEPQDEDGRQGEKAAQERKPGTALATRKQTKRQRPLSSPEVSVRLTRAAKKRRASSGQVREGRK